MIRIRAVFVAALIYRASTSCKLGQHFIKQGRTSAMIGPDTAWRTANLYSGL